MKKEITEHTQYYVCPVCRCQKVYFISNEKSKFYHCNCCERNFDNKEYSICSSCGLALIKNDTPLCMCKICYDYKLNKLEKE